MSDNEHVAVSDWVIEKALEDADNRKFVRVGIDGEVIDTSKVITASEAETCIRALYYDKNNHIATSSVIDYYGEPVNIVVAEPNVDTYEMEPEGYFARGRAIEDYYVSLLHKVVQEDSDLEIMFTGKDQVTLTDENGLVVGTPDGVIIDHVSRLVRVLEIKSTADANPYAKFEHVTQLSINICLVEQYLASTMDVGGYSYEGELVYINASNWLQIQPYIVSYKSARTRFERIKVRANKLFYGKFEDLPYEGVKKNQCSRCIHSDVCFARLEKDYKEGNANAVVVMDEYKRQREVEKSKVPFRDFSDDEVLERCKEAAELYVKAKMQADEYSKFLDKIRDDVIAYLHHCDDSVVFHDTKISATYHGGRVTADVNKLKQDGLFEQYSRQGEPYFAIRLSKAKQKD